MKVLDVQATNFASYKNLELSFDNQGLVLIHGATGSGKSTIQDLVCWALFGKTAKGGTVDEVRSWDSTEPTTVSLGVEIKSNIIHVVRVRGAAQQNDLYFSTDRKTDIRGKDITETQTLLNEVLGFDFDLYFTAAYFSEFSPTSTFFTANAKQKREIFEKIANLSVPEYLLTQAAEKKKTNNGLLKTATHELALAQGKLEQTELLEKSRKAQYDRWEASHVKQLEALEVQDKYFKQNKEQRIQTLLTKAESSNLFLNKKKQEIYDKLEKIKRLTPEERDAHVKQIASLAGESVCSHCGGVNKKSADKINKIQAVLDKDMKAAQDFMYLKLELQNLNNHPDEYGPLIESIKNEANPHSEQIKTLAKTKNPYAAVIDLQELKDKLTTAEQNVNNLNNKVALYEQLTDVFNKMRSTLLVNSLQDIETKTNDKLSKYFDSPFKVEFKISSTDKLLTTIHKEGIQCSYTQLSKGQRGLLKLCFMTSVMEAASNRAGIHFDTLFMDEALDGLDESLKEKAFGMLEVMSLNHSSIFFIEHSESFKNLFDNKYHVTNDGQGSHLEQS